MKSQLTLLNSARGTLSLNARRLFIIAVALGVFTVSPRCLARPKAEIEIAELPRSARNELELRIRRINISGLRMSKAVYTIATEADKWLWADPPAYLCVQ